MNPLVGLVMSVVGKAIDSFFPAPEDKAKAEALKASVENAVIGQLLGTMQSFVEQQVKVLVAEAQSTSWLTSNWRPVTMLSFVCIIVNNYILYPYLSLFWHAAPVLEIPMDLWELLKIGIGGYVTSRGVEKVMDTWASAQKEKKGS